jgi:hypothetical protein
MLFLGFGGMAIGQFMAILDIQIVAASLPQIQAGVEASADQISWIQTAYLIPEVVMIPLSAYLARLWGTQKVFMAQLQRLPDHERGGRLLDQHRHDDRLPGAAGLCRRGHGADGLRHRLQRLPAGAAGHGQCGHRHDRHPGPDRRSDPGRPPDRLAELALAVLHQRRAGPAEPVPGRALRQFRQGRPAAGHRASTGSAWS